MAVVGLALFIGWRLGAFSGEEKRVVAEDLGPAGADEPGVVEAKPAAI